MSRPTRRRPASNRAARGCAASCRFRVGACVSQNVGFFFEEAKTMCVTVGFFDHQAYHVTRSVTARGPYYVGPRRVSRVTAAAARPRRASPASRASLSLSFSFSFFAFRFSYKRRLGGGARPPRALLFRPLTFPPLRRPSWSARARRPRRASPRRPRARPRWRPRRRRTRRPSCTRRSPARRRRRSAGTPARPP